MHDVFRRLYLRRFGVDVESIAPIAVDGSARRMSRVRGTDGRTAIAVVGPDAEENRAFLSFSASFRGIGLPVPEVLIADEAAGIYLVEDLGDVTLFRALTDARTEEGERAKSGGAFPSSMLPIYRRVLETLPRFQVEGGRAVDYGVAYPRAAFDRQSMTWDLNYFKYHFLKLAHVPFNEDRLERDLGRLVDFLLTADVSHFLYRDFQSRNVMLRGEDPWFIDYQGGRRGALQYDVASILYDAKAAIPEDVRESLLDHYLTALSTHLPVDRDRFREHYRGYVVIRILQAMGAYGYRGWFERKPHFLQSVPPAVANIERILATGFVPLDLPELRSVLERICNTPAFRSVAPRAGIGLSVRVGSFSYREGYPDDPTGNGGGFVFDCRAIVNPGLMDAFRPLNGLDPEVRRFLDREAGVDPFFEHARALVEAQVATYVQRGWTALDVQFGCTGGQHRSVYFAERLAITLRGYRPDVRVVVTHRERARWPKRQASDAGPAPAPFGSGKDSRTGPESDLPQPPISKSQTGSD